MDNQGVGSGDENAGAPGGKNGHESIGASGDKNSGASRNLVPETRARKVSISERKKFDAPLLDTSNSRAGASSSRSQELNGAVGRIANGQTNSTLGTADQNMVEEQTTTVVNTFMSTTYQLGFRHHTGEGDTPPASPGTPGFEEGVINIQELNEQPRINPLDPAVQAGQTLAQLGDEFTREYQPVLDDLAQQLLTQLHGNVSTQVALDMFKKIASQVLTAQEFSLGRVVAVLCFGYRWAMAMVRNGVRNIIPWVVDVVVRYLIGANITRWIAMIGGWTSMITTGTAALVVNGGWLQTLFGVNPIQVGFVVLALYSVYSYFKR